MFEPQGDVLLYNKMAVAFQAFALHLSANLSWVQTSACCNITMWHIKMSEYGLRLLKHVGIGCGSQEVKYIISYKYSCTTELYHHAL